jgi:hypothetical protein
LPENPTPTPVPSTISGASGNVISVVNASQQTGIATALVNALAAHGFTKGHAANGYTRSESVIEYGSGAADAASSLASILGIANPTAEGDLPDNTVRLTVGTDFTPPPGLIPRSEQSDITTTTTTPPAVPTAVNATGVGSDAPAPTDLSSLTDAGGPTAGVPCVK